MSLELIQQQAVKTYNENIAYFKEYHPKLYENLVIFETALNENHIQAKFDLQYKENYFEIIGLEQNIPFYGQNSVELSKKMVNDAPLFDATKNSFKTYYEHQYNDEIAQIALESDMLVKYTLSNAPIVHYVNKNLPNEQILNDIHKFIIFGVGLGLHITHIHEQINAKMYCIIEPNLEIFRLSLFVTNYADLAKESKLFLSVAQNEVAFRETFNKFYAESFILNHYLKFFQFGQGHDLYIKTIQNSLVSQPHYLYSYDRTFLSLFRTHSYISQDYNTINIAKKHQLPLFEKPILYLAAGPSLQKNIGFVKSNQDKFIIVAIYATMPLLETHGIKPDIITQYDEQDIQVLNTLDKIKNINFFNDTTFIFSSHVNAKLMTAFPKHNIFIFQAMFELKKEYGMLTSPSIGELTYGILLKLGAKNIYILGLDFAMDAETNQTHIDGHSGSNIFNELKDLEDSQDTEYSYRKNTILVKGNFLPEVKSIPVFKTNIDSFGVFSKQLKSQDCNVFNLSNGAYLEGAIPTKISDVNLESLDIMNDVLQKNIGESLSSISEINYNTKDIKNISLKISGAKKIKKALENFIKIKNYKTLDEYKNSLIILLSDILFSKYNCQDLQQILINYSSHVVHHVFYLFSLNNIGNQKKHLYEINKALNNQISKIINTYVISISYSKTESIPTKKLNKFIKEYSIKGTAYSEPQLKELVETSLKGEQTDIGTNSIGFFAIEENLKNENFVMYLCNILKLDNNIKMKLFYFYNYQRVIAENTFKHQLEKIEFIIPNSIEEIASQVELWIESTTKTLSLRKTTDIFLNNYSNIYSIMFNNTEYTNLKLNYDQQIKDHTQQSLINIIRQNYFVPSTPYFNFCNKVTKNTEIETLKHVYKKNFIGFFAFEENITKEFIQNIYSIHNHFPQINFSIFYFENSQKEKYQTQFSHMLNRCNFIQPNSVSDIIENTQIWLEADIKFKSFIFNKMSHILSKTFNIYQQIIDKEYQIQKPYNEPLESIISNFNQQCFMKSLLKENNLNNVSAIDSKIGFLIQKDTLEDSGYIMYIKQLKELVGSNKMIGFCFEEKLEDVLIDFNIKIITINSITHIHENSNIFLWNQKEKGLSNRIINALNHNPTLHISFSSKRKNLSIRDFEKNDKTVKRLLSNLDYLDFSSNEAKEANNTFYVMLNNRALHFIQNELWEKITEETTYNHFFYFLLPKYFLDSKEFMNFFYKLFYIKNKSLKNNKGNKL